MHRALTSLLALLGVLVTTWLLWVFVVAVEEPPPPAPPRDLGPVPVRVRAVEARDVVVEVEAFGNLTAARRTELALEVGGRIGWISERWHPGATVEEGEPLLRLEPELATLDVRAAEASLEVAEADVLAAEVEVQRWAEARRTSEEASAVATREHERLVELGGITSEATRDRALRERLAAREAADAAKASLEAARAAHATASARVLRATVELERAREALLRTELLAPYRGRLVGRAPGPGSHVVPGAPLGTLVDADRLLLEARVPERDLLRMALGQEARVTLPGAPELWEGPVVAGRVTGIGAESDPTTRRGTVEVTVEASALGFGPLAETGAENGAERSGAAFLPAGLFARARVEVERRTGALWVERGAFRWEAGEPVCFVLAGAGGSAEDRTAERRVLSFEREHGEGFLVREGLAAGDLLILSPLDRVEEGTLVRVLEEEGGER